MNTSSVLRRNPLVPNTLKLFVALSVYRSLPMRQPLVKLPLVSNRVVIVVKRPLPLLQSVLVFSLIPQPTLKSVDSFPILLSVLELSFISTELVSEDPLPVKLVIEVKFALVSELFPMSVFPLENSLGLVPAVVLTLELMVFSLFLPRPIELTIFELPLI